MKYVQCFSKVSKWVSLLVASSVVSWVLTMQLHKEVSCIFLLQLLHQDVPLGFSWVLVWL